MPAEDKWGGMIPTREHAAEDLSFDGLARGLASGAISRRTAIKSLAAAGIAALFGWGIGLQEAEAGNCRGNFCRGDERRCGRNRPDCVCYRTPNGDTVCAADNGECQSCNENRDCPNGFICVQNGSNCCPQENGGRRMKNVCAAPCEGNRATAARWAGAA